MAVRQLDYIDYLCPVCMTIVLCMFLNPLDHWLYGSIQKGKQNQCIQTKYVTDDGFFTLVSMKIARARFSVVTISVYNIHRGMLNVFALPVFTILDLALFPLNSLHSAMNSSDVNSVTISLYKPIVMLHAINRTQGFPSDFALFLQTSCPIHSTPMISNDLPGLTLFPGNNPGGIVLNALT